MIWACNNVCCTYISTRSATLLDYVLRNSLTGLSWLCSHWLYCISSYLKEILRKQVQRLYFYPWVFAILFIIPFVNRYVLGHSGGEALSLHWQCCTMVPLRNCSYSRCTLLYVCRIRLAAGYSVRNSDIPVELSFILWYLHALTLPFLGECVNSTIFMHFLFASICKMLFVHTVMW